MTVTKNAAINICTAGHIFSLKRRIMTLLLFTALVFFETQSRVFVNLNFN